ncbi:restriction endonuclease [Niameybacter massiliensis]|uniref:Restriction endonuclease n=1 Tax=Holtiella tumoricola TaxID=3018743 RepID=A0AA42DKS9_9FIRM|nr:restriction endonuclease [Holtiella tumoricola]MDA3730543.1 restriction endonuclease [Holtiella tumoricola]
MKTWIKISLFVSALLLYFWFILRSSNIISALTKILIVALLLLGMESVRRDREKTFLMCSDINQIKKMEQDEFVAYTANLYKRLGYFIDLLKSKDELGCDIIAREKQDIICIKCVSGAEEIGILPLQQVYGSMNLYKANKCMLITTSTYSEKAKQFAKANHVNLIDQQELLKKIMKVTNEKEATKVSSSTQEV